MIVLEHVLVGPKVYILDKGLLRQLTKLVIILSELSVANGAVLVDDASHFHSPAHSGRITAEFDHLDLTAY